MLIADNLHKSFGKREVVRGVSMEVEPGNVVGLLGPNGAGKTTCFYMIVGLVRADHGEITVGEIGQKTWKRTGYIRPYMTPMTSNAGASSRPSGFSCR